MKPKQKLNNCKLHNDHNYCHNQKKTKFTLVPVRK